LKQFTTKIKKVDEFLSLKKSAGSNYGSPIFSATPNSLQTPIEKCRGYLVLLSRAVEKMTGLW
jgi:hypothetical protein